MDESELNEDTDRIVDIQLDETSVVRRSLEVEHERRVAIHDLLEMNRFKPLGGYEGPYLVRLSWEDNKRISMKVLAEDGTDKTAVSLPLTPFRRIVKDYFQICESYYDAIKKLSPSQIETIDMARRGLHNEGSDLLQEVLRDKVKMDKATARRLFTLVCVLHIRG